jgi:bifunctional non-homologous end joining protein LigD
MECTPVPTVPDDPAKWIYEVKLDGYRCCAIVRNGKGFLYSRYGNAWPQRFPAITAALARLHPPMILDGEIVAVDAQGRPSFQELQNWQSTRLTIVFYAFDITNLDGRDLRRLPLEERKEILTEVASQFSDPLRVAATLDAKLTTLIPKMKKLGLEGIVAKRRGSRYESGKRATTWLKHRFNQVEEFVIGGYVLEDEELARVLVGVWRDDKLVFVKKLKNGFTDFTRRQVLDAVSRLRVRECPFVNPQDVDAEDPFWVRPTRTVEVEFVEWTSGGKLRHASFRELVVPASPPKR